MNLLAAFTEAFEKAAAFQTPVGHVNSVNRADVNKFFSGKPLPPESTLGKMFTTRHNRLTALANKGRKPQVISPVTGNTRTWRGDRT